MVAEDWSHRWNDFINYTRILDNSRKENISDLVPELKYD
jgi:hypothetical protein